MDEDHEWSLSVASEYNVAELEAMCTWLDVNLDLNQQRLDAVTTRVGLVVTLGAANIALLAATAKTGWTLVLFLIALITTALSMTLATAGLQARFGSEGDVTTLWATLWLPREEGEVLAILYRNRSNLIKDQRRVLASRADSLRSSAWMLGAASGLTAAAILVAQLAKESS